MIFVNCYRRSDTGGSGPGLANVRHAGRCPWHLAFTAVPVFYISFARPPSPHCEQYVCTYRYLTAYRLTVNCCADMQRVMSGIYCDN